MNAQFIKNYNNSKNKELNLDLFNREIYWLDKLEQYGFSPSIINVDYDKLEITMTFEGIPLTKDNLPEDWKTQIIYILDIFNNEQLKHNDLRLCNSLVKNNKLKVIDFEYASINNDFSCNGNIELHSSFHETKRVYVDNEIINEIEYTFIKPKNILHELHVFVLWNTSERKYIEEKLKEKFFIRRSIIYPKYSSKKIRNNILDKFYNFTTDKHAKKGLRKFIVYYVIDYDPKYDYRNVRDECIKVNINTYDLKIELRQGRTGYLHASNNIEESHDNLISLNQKTGKKNQQEIEKIPLYYWDEVRPRFNSLTELFERLNTFSNLQYLVLRNYDNYPDEFILDEHGDIDILTNDYFLFKAICGGKSFKHLFPKTNRGYGPRVEDGGYKVANKIIINNIEVMVDIRYVGDNYYDEKWEINMLSNRVLYKNLFYIMNTTDYFYSLLYHGLIHKHKISNTYIKKYNELSNKLNIQININDNICMRKILDSFMKLNNYKYTKPNELSIPFNYLRI